MGVVYSMAVGEWDHIPKRVCRNYKDHESWPIEAPNDPDFMRQSYFVSAACFPFHFEGESGKYFPRQEIKAQSLSLRSV
jgi:hypothetical protein